MAKRSKDKDPFLSREAANYTHPVPSREFIIEYLEGYGKPASLKHLITAFQLKSKEENEGIRRRLKAMERDGQLMVNRRGSYALVNEMELVKARVIGHRDGFGFAVPDEGGKDIFLSARQMRGVFNDDRVLVRVTGIDARQRREGVIVEVLERNTLKTVGRYFKESSIAFVRPDNKAITQDIIVSAEETAGIKPGEFVEVEIITQPSLRRQPTGRITKTLGDYLTPGVEVELAIRSYQLPFEWPEALLAEAATIQPKLSSSDYEGREDLRELAFVTIDGEDAKDFDDAVYCESLPEGGWKLWVAIADVAHYVKAESALDREAIQRGNSVYFPSKVIPMLPEILSNELCSLRPQVDRLAMVCEIYLNQEGSLIKHRFMNAVIHSKARLTYTQVAAYLAREKSAPELKEVSTHLDELHQLYKKLLQQRELRGAIDFDTVETRIIFDDKGKIARIVPTERNEAHRLIEEMMLLANVCASQFVQKAKIEALYRNHELPDEQKLSALRDFMQVFGLRLSGGDNPTAMDYANLLERIQKRADAHLLQTVLLRSLKQAHYSPTNAGHFGLAFDGYCHFTSPIRRYPDLLLHRAIKHVLQKQDPKKFPYTETRMQELGQHFSMTERRADRATRDALDWLKCDYMKDKVGQSFAGVIADVTGFGVFVELKDIFVEGLLHITALKNDYYHHDAIHHVLVGKQSGAKYRLGDSIQVRVVRVDLDDRQIEFDLA
ncbi:MAG TPA: ribonuclease R [Coxiellaceae bacterium]|nr:ribonuclease R [Coxiellaceae bacterium]